MIPTEMSNKVYSLSSKDPKVQLNPIVIRPHVVNDRVEWEDTDRGGYIKFQKIEISKTHKQIRITGKAGEVILLTLLTLKIYNEKLKHRVSGHPEFSSDDELMNYYLNTNFYG